MRLASAGASVARHGLGAVLEAVLLIALAIVLVFGIAPILGGSPAGAPSALAAKPLSGHITVVEPVGYGQSTTATVNPGGTDVYVFVQCYTPDFGGEYVYAAYFPANAEKQATIGPLWSTLWLSGGASCRASEGYFTRSGFGKWVLQAETTFTVTP